MQVNLSAAEIGAIVSALESVYPDGSAEMDLAQQLADIVYQFLGDEMYYEWVKEFDLVSF